LCRYAAAVYPGGAAYVPVNIALICFFNYFYTFLQLEPKAGLAAQVVCTRCIHTLSAQVVCTSCLHKLSALVSTLLERIK
jgi:hypothetical protein